MRNTNNHLMCRKWGKPHKPWTSFHGPRNQYAIQCHTANITNVTNVAQVHVDGEGAWKPRKRKHGHKHHGHFERRERPPKLFRFCSSCGILDRDVASNMSEGMMCQEAVNVIGYSARGLADCTSTFARNASHHLGEAAEGLWGVVSGIFGLFCH